MKYYEQLIELGCFHTDELIEITGSIENARNTLYQYQKRGLVEQVKKNLYTVISLETKQPISTRYEIGTKLFEDAVISHHSAFEMYGYGNQVYYDCYVATKSRFRDFEYNGVTFHRIKLRDDLDVINIGKTRVTSIEQTIVDSIRDFEKIAGLEEILRCLLLIPGIDEDKVLDILDNNKNGFLYQKCGYIFEAFNDEVHFSSGFFDNCSLKSTKSRRYLIKGFYNCIYNEKWKLYVPSDLRGFIDKGVSYYDAI